MTSWESIAAQTAPPATWQVVLTVVGTLAAVISTIAAVWGISRTARAAEEASRPVMSAELRTLPLVRGTTVLVVSNRGRALARNVRVQFAPELPPAERSEAAGNVLLAFLSRRFARAYPTIAPGAELRNLYAQVVGNGNREDAPNDLTVHISYEGRSRRWGGPRVYDDRYDLTLDLFRDSTSTNRNVQSTEDAAKLTAQAVETLAHRWG
ncbi:hypothetical protein [Allobranchiibius sp. CTAmp26]|uniref:hypothetical protein n=1 Tax=Allobranchiibius sp. CTAmp26 TaxID=2815214 RepID=UPI001AA0FA14|nr:hypothetical protein [Allobranchiibius sp. CTAmp26]MBO1756480.1 hypothetical protein [Allobranchiibius sp. CTAmp26]